MSLRNDRVTFGHLLLSAALASLGGGGLVACSSSSNPTPVYTVGSDAGDSSTTNDAAAPDASHDAPTDGTVSDTSTGDGQAPPDALVDGSTDAVTDAPFEDAAACATDAGCWKCAPVTTPEYLNQCTSSQCTPFNNAARLPNYDGGLPPLN